MTLLQHLIPHIFSFCWYIKPAQGMEQWEKDTAHHNRHTGKPRAEARPKGLRLSELLDPKQYQYSILKSAKQLLSLMVAGSTNETISNPGLLDSAFLDSL